MKSLLLLSMFSIENGVKMKIEYNDKFDLLYLRFDETTQQVTNQRINENIVLDLDKDNKLVGIEILNAMDVINLGSLLPLNFVNTNEKNLEPA